MAAPTVFVSSTFYDLRYVRESVTRFIDSMGFVPLLSEAGTVFYNPKEHTADACIREVVNADMFVLLIGGRYGSNMPSSGQSVTNAEYLSAVKQGIPVFALVEQGTHNDYYVYRSNADRLEALVHITFPHADDHRIFAFIDEVQGQATNNALQPFGTATDVEDYLRKQWAGMMHSFLTQQMEAVQVSGSLEMLADVNARIERLSETILERVGDPIDKATMLMLREMLVSQAVSDLRYFGIDVTPAMILDSETFQECAKHAGVNVRLPDPGDDFLITGSGEISAARLDAAERDYQRLRDTIRRTLREQGVDETEFKNYPLARTLPSTARPGARVRAQLSLARLEDRAAILQVRLREAEENAARNPNDSGAAAHAEALRVAVMDNETDLRNLRAAAAPEDD